ncbi:MAG: hypothetical protein ABSF66_03435 [Terriglobales bacterium]|jgi:hypothetical protein
MKLYTAALLALCAFAHAQNTITIGSLTFLWSGPGTGGDACIYEGKFDTTGVLQEPLIIRSETMYNSNGQPSFPFGPWQTPASFQEIIGCNDIVSGTMQIQLSKSGGPVTLTLANGDTFKTAGIVTVVIQALPGKKALRKNQAVPIVLTQIVP